MIAPSAVGRWDAMLFDRFRASKGALRRRLLGELIVVNEPLIKTLVAQLCGRGEIKKRRGQQTRLGGMQGSADLPWDDALQAGRLGFAAACERFDPSKGKISFYALHRIRFELQKIIPKEPIIYSPPRSTRIDLVPKPVALVGGSQELDELYRLATEPDEDEDDYVGPAPANDVAPAALAVAQTRFQEAQATPLAKTFAEASGEAPGPLEEFFAVACAFAGACRVPVLTLWRAYERHCRRAGAIPLAPVAFSRQTAAHGHVRGTWMRVDWNPTPVRAWRGVRFCPSDTVCTIDNEAEAESGCVVKIDRPTFGPRLWTKMGKKLTQKTRIELSTLDTARLQCESLCARDTIRKWAKGGQVCGATSARLERAARKLGLPIDEGPRAA